MFEGLRVVEGNLEGCGWNWVGCKGSAGEWPGQCEDGGNVEILCNDSGSYVEQTFREQSNILYRHIDIKFEQRNTICDVLSSPQSRKVAVISAPDGTLEDFWPVFLWKACFDIRRLASKLLASEILASQMQLYKNEICAWPPYQSTQSQHNPTLWQYMLYPFISHQLLPQVLLPHRRTTRSQRPLTLRIPPQILLRPLPNLILQ